MTRLVPRPARSILRPASTDRSNGSCVATSTKRVTFADDFHVVVFSPSTPRQRPPPPSTIPPPTLPPFLPSPSPGPRPIEDSSPEPSQDVSRPSRQDVPNQEAPVHVAARALKTRPEASTRSTSRSATRKATPLKTAGPLAVRPSDSEHADDSPHPPPHHHGHHRCKKRTDPRTSDRRDREKPRPGSQPSGRTQTRRSSPVVEDAVSQSERAARQKRKNEAGVVKKRTSPERRRRSGSSSSRMSSSARETVGGRRQVVDGRKVSAGSDLPRDEADAGKENVLDSAGGKMRRRSSGTGQVEKLEAKVDAKRSDRKRKQEQLKRDRRIKHLRSRGLMAKAKVIIAETLDFSRSGYSVEMLDAVEARTIFKLIVQCRELSPSITGALWDDDRQWQENKFRKALKDEDAELGTLLASRLGQKKSDKLRSDSSRFIRKQRNRLAHLVANESDADIGTVQRMRRSQLEKAVLDAMRRRFTRLAREIPRNGVR